MFLNTRGDAVWDADSGVGPRNRVINGVQMPTGRGNFWKLFAQPHQKAPVAFAAVYAKTAEPIEMPFEG